MAGFVFFDTETTGLVPGFDQIVHFAAIRTDPQLKELDRFEVRSRLQPHVVPHPRALLTNGLKIEALVDANLPSHYEMMCAIALKLAQWSPAIFVGYNSISFDEEMLRHSFFQTLHDAYLTTRPGNGRADAMSLALAAYALPPHHLQVSVKADGRRSFRLTDIAAANGLLHDRAHNALSDVVATLELCRLVAATSHDVWQSFQRFANKAGVAQFVDAEDGFVLTEFFGGEAVHRPVACIGQPPNNQNGRFCLDLSRPPEHWSVMSDEDMRDELCRKGTPLRRLAINAAPSLTELWAAPDEFLGGLSFDEAEDRARRLRADADLCSRIVDIYTASWTDREPSAFAERQLYHGSFPSDADKYRMRTFHDATRGQRLKIVRELEDPRLVTFGRRLLHAEHRGSLSEAERVEGDLKLAERLLEAQDGPLTLRAAMLEVDGLIAEGVPDDSGILVSFRSWLVSRISRIQDYRTAHSAALSA